MTARKPEPLCPYRHFIDEDTRNPRGRVRSTLKILEDRERGENEVQMCSNGRMEEMCYAVIEASDLLDAARASLAAAERERVAQLEAALRECIEYCEGIQTPPPWMEQCRAALAVTAVANPGSAGIAEPTQEPEG